MLYQSLPLSVIVSNSSNAFLKLLKQWKPKNDCHFVERKLFYTYVYRSVTFLLTLQNAHELTHSCLQESWWNIILPHLHPYGDLYIERKYSGNQQLEDESRLIQSRNKYCTYRIVETTWSGPQFGCLHKTKFCSQHTTKVFNYNFLQGHRVLNSTGVCPEY